MSYSQELSNGIVMPLGSSALDVETVSAAAAVHGEHIVMKRCKIKRLMFAVTTAIAADTTAPVIEFNRRITLGSGTGEVQLGQLTLPDTTAIGSIIYKDIDPVTLEVGDSISCEHVTQAVDGTSAAGAGFYGFELDLAPEEAANESNMTASA